MFTPNSLPSATTRPRRIDNDDVYNDVLDEHGVIRDGKRLRVAMTDAKPMPLLQMSAAPPQRSAPMVIGGNNMEVKREMRKHFHADGSPKPSREVRDRERAREQKAADVASAAVAFDAQYGGSHRPGFRFADTADTADAGIAAKEVAYAAMVNDISTSWMRPDQRAQHDAERAIADAAPPAGVDAREWERAKMIERTVWKGDSTNPTDAMSFLQKGARDNQFWNQPLAPPKSTDDVAAARNEMIDHMTEQWQTRDEPAVSNRPATAWGQAGLAAKAGDPCMTNAGEAGVLREEGGWLYCEASYLGATRSGEQSAGDVPVTRADAIPTSRSALDAMTPSQGQAVRDAAYHAMVAEQSEAWRKQG